MDTKEKTRQRKSAAEPRKRPAKEAKETPTRRDTRNKEGTDRRREDAARQRKAAAPEEIRRKRRAAAETEQPRRPRPAAQASAQEEVFRHRPAQQPVSRSARVRENGVAYSAPQGTGPRKSAPKLSAEETAALRRQQQARTPATKPEKKNNALQNLISGVKGGQEDPKDPAAKARARREQRQKQEEKKRKQAQRHDTPAVIYTQPMAFNRDRFLVQVLSVVAVVAAMVIGMSVFFKVETITVAGAETYKPSAVSEASGIKEGDNLLTFSKARAVAKIHAELSYVDNVRIGIKLPDTVIIYIEELDVAYAVESIHGDWWLINSQGRIVNQIRGTEAANYTKVLGVTLEEPQIGNQAIAANEIPAETLESGEPVPITVTGTQRLTAALQILKALEANDIVGDAASVDVTELDDIVLRYGNRYEVLLGDNTDMEYKIACMNDAILELSDYQSGILDVSFTTWTEEVGYTPFG